MTSLAERLNAAVWRCGRDDAGAHYVAVPLVSALLHRRGFKSPRDIHLYYAGLQPVPRGGAMWLLLAEEERGTTAHPGRVWRLAAGAGADLTSAIPQGAVILGDFPRVAQVLGCVLAQADLSVREWRTLLDRLQRVCGLFEAVHRDGKDPFRDYDAFLPHLLKAVEPPPTVLAELQARLVARWLRQQAARGGG